MLTNPMEQEVVYHLGKHDSDTEAYQALTQAISEIADHLNQNVYTAIWKSENHDHGSEYRVVDSSRILKEDTLIIEGASRGGTYEIVPKPNNPPIIRYHPNGEIGWTEEALSLVITLGTFAYQNEDDHPTFFDFVKDQIGL